MTSKYAILFKSVDEIQCDKDPFSDEFEKLGIKSQVIPVLKFDFINLEALKEKLNKADDYSGLVIVSPRCVRAIKMAGADISRWRTCKIFVVGEKTAKLVETELGLLTEGGFSGNAEALAQYILGQNILKALLLPMGNLSKEVLSNILIQGGIQLDRICVYETVADTTAELTIKKAFDEHPVSYVMYFSPSAVDVTFPMINKLGISINEIKWGAIGPSTEEALKKRSVVPCIVPESPTPQHLAVALENLLKC